MFLLLPALWDPKQHLLAPRKREATPHPIHRTREKDVREEERWSAVKMQTFCRITLQEQPMFPLQALSRPPHLLHLHSQMPPTLQHRAIGKQPPTPLHLERGKLPPTLLQKLKILKRGRGTSRFLPAGQSMTLQTFSVISSPRLRLPLTKKFLHHQLRNFQDLRRGEGDVRRRSGDVQPLSIRITSSPTSLRTLTVLSARRARLSKPDAAGSQETLISLTVYRSPLLSAR